MTRPLGASLADWLGKPTADGGVGFGAGPTSLVLAAAIAVLVAVIGRPSRAVAATHRGVTLRSTLSL